jgi:hypothetical protein
MPCALCLLRCAVQSAAKQRGVKLMSYNVIYDLVDDVRAAMEGRLKTGAPPSPPRSLCRWAALGSACGGVGSHVDHRVGVVGISP